MDEPQGEKWSLAKELARRKEGREREQPVPPGSLPKSGVSTPEVKRPIRGKEWQELGEPVPADIKVIGEKIRDEQKLTPEEQKRWADWQLDQQIAKLEHKKHEGSQ